MEPNRRYFSRCKSGNRWFWVVFTYEDYCRDRDPIASGFADSADAAHTAAFLAGSVGQHANRVAEDYRRRNAAMRRTPKPQAEPADVYCCSRCFSDCGDDFDSIRPHRIVKRTAKCVYVEDVSHDLGRESHWSDRCIVLDRERLERDGKVEHGPSRKTFYIDPAVYYAERKGVPA